MALCTWSVLVHYGVVVNTIDQSEPAAEVDPYHSGEDPNMMMNYGKAVHQVDIRLTLG